MTEEFKKLETVYTFSFPTPYVITENGNFLVGENKRQDLNPSKIFLNGRTMIVLWNDGTKTQSTASKNDVFDVEIGFGICLMKKMFGKKIYGKQLFKRMIKKNLEVQSVDGDVQESINTWISNYSNDPIPF